jgi:hypothetical protein
VGCHSYGRGCICFPRYTITFSYVIFFPGKLNTVSNESKILYLLFHKKKVIVTNNSDTCRPFIIYWLHPFDTYTH